MQERPMRLLLVLDLAVLAKLLSKFSHLLDLSFLDGSLRLWR